MSHIEKAKAAINDRLAAAHLHRGDYVTYHSQLRGALDIVVRLLADTRQQSAHSIRMLQELARKTLAAIERVDNDEKARLD